MIIVEFCCVDRASGRSEHRQLSLETPRSIGGHQRLVEAIGGAGSVPCLQLQHGGQGAKRALLADGMPVAPSDVFSRNDPDRRIARALADAEIERLIDCFGRSAELGVQAGYQAFELHGAHGYLLTSFISPFTNRRDDTWGGDEERRLSFPRRVIERVKQAIGDRPLIYRLSADEFAPGGLTIDDMGRIAPKLAAAGADALHVSIGLGWTSFDKVIEPMSMPEGWRLPYARRIRAAAGVPVIAVGQIRWPQTAERALQNGDTDLIALGRPLLADPEWAGKARRGDDGAIRPCTSCNYCVTMSSGEHGAIGCAENPRTGRELEALPAAGELRGRLAVVVGGGPGGMAAALMLDQIGMRTRLYEARDEVGGGLIASAAPPFKEKLVWYQDYLLRRLRQSGVQVSTGTRVDIELLAQQPPRFVVLAHGGRAIELPIPGRDSDIVLDAYEILMGQHANRLPAPDGLPIVVYGGGETGCESAEYLAELGHRVILVSRSPLKLLARSAEAIYRGVLLQRLHDNERIRLIGDTAITAIDETGAVELARKDGARERLDCSRVLIAQGRTPDPLLEAQLIAANIPHATIGDARQGGRIGDAVHNAYTAIEALCATAAPVRQLAC
jgi:2,4-dienoyl-CoA reductase-like NADH-dependent reductase (Old Yellow Enzyme family)/thioredoxin reductase